METSKETHVKDKSEKETQESFKHDWSCMYDTRNPLLRAYNHSIAKTVNEFLEIKETDTVLDFGCGNQKIKKFLSPCKYIGFDINPKFTDVSNYEQIGADKVLAVHVLEHISNKDFLRFTDFIKKGKPKKFVTALPTENWISKIGRLLFLGRTNREHMDHFLTLKEINSFLKNEGFVSVKKKMLWTMTEVREWSYAERK